jgi:hypothetical protein
MILSNEFSTDCPDGYQPIPLPSEWKTRDLLGNVNYLRIKFNVPEGINSLDPLMTYLTERLSDRNNSKIASACKQSMMKNRRNIFRISLDDSVIEDITNQIKSSCSEWSKNREVSICSDGIWIYQKCSDKPLV